MAVIQGALGSNGVSPCVMLPPSNSDEGGRSAPLAHMFPFQSNHIQSDSPITNPL